MTAKGRWPASGLACRAAAFRGLVYLGAVAITLVASCGGHTDKKIGHGGDLAAGAPADSLEMLVALDSGSYAVDEPLKMRLTVLNRTDRALTLRFATAQRFDFVVRQGGKVIWQWSADMMFAQAVGRETIAPGDSLAYTAEWNQRLSDGTNPGLGAYTLQGILKTSPETAAPERPFGIVD